MLRTVVQITVTLSSTASNIDLQIFEYEPFKSTRTAIVLPTVLIITTKLYRLI